MSGSPKLLKAGQGAQDAHSASSACILDAVPADLLPRIVAHLQTPLDRYNASRATWRFEHALAQLGFRLHISKSGVGRLMAAYVGVQYTLHQAKLVTFSSTGGCSFIERSTLLLNKPDVVKVKVAAAMVHCKRRDLKALNGMKNVHAFDRRINYHFANAWERAAAVLEWLDTLRPSSLPLSYFEPQPAILNRVVQDYSVWQNTIQVINDAYHAMDLVLVDQNPTLKTLKKTYSDAAFVREIDGLDGKARLLNASRKKWTDDRKRSEREAALMWSRVV
jgi:hypothetical protein